MNYVTTNIRIPEEDYLRLKEEAARKRKSFAAVVRDKLGSEHKIRSKDEVKKLLEARDKAAKMLGEKLKDFDVVAALREMRTQR